MNKRQNNNNQIGENKKKLLNESNERGKKKPYELQQFQTRRQRTHSRQGAPEGEATDENEVEKRNNR